MFSHSRTPFRAIIGAVLAATVVTLGLPSVAGAATELVDCDATPADIGAVQAAVDAAVDGGTITLKGTCDFSAAAAHGGDVASIAAAAVVIRPNTPIDGLTITSDGSPQSASVVGGGTQTAFFVAPGQNNVTIRGLRFVNFARPLVTANNTNTTFGGGTAVPDLQANRILGNASMNSAILGIGNQMGASGQVGQMTVGYGPADQNGQPTQSATFTFPATVTLSGFKALGNYISFDPPGVPDGANRDVVGVDVRQRGAASVADVQIARNAVGMFSSEFPIFNMNGVKVHALSPDTTPHITGVSIQGNNLGRFEEISNPSFPVDPADVHAAGRAGILVIHAGDVSVTGNGVRTRMSPTLIPMPGGGIVLSDVSGGVVDGNAVIVVADPSTESSDLGAIGLVDDVNVLFSSASGGPPTRDILVTNNFIGTVDDSGAPLGAQRGILLNGVEHSTVTDNTVRFSSRHALNIGVAVTGPGSVGSPGPVTLQNPVREAVACKNSLDGTVDDPSEVAFNSASGSVNNAFPGGYETNSGNMFCAVVVNVSDTLITGGEDQTVTGNAWPGRPFTLTLVDASGGSISRSITAGSNKNYSEVFTATDLAPLADGPIRVNGTSSDDLGSTAVGTGFRNFTKDTTPPATPTIVTPSEGGIVTTTSVNVSGTGDAGSVVTVQESGTTLGTADVLGDGTWSLDSSFADGTHVISATAADVAGNVSSPSADRTFTVDTIAPGAPVITSPVNGDTFTANPVMVAGTAEPGSTVAVIEGPDEIASVPVDGTGAWSVDLTFSDGEHTVTAEASDAAGNVSPQSDEVTFLVDANVPGAPVIAAPADGAVLSEGDVDVSGSAEAGSTVTVLEGGSSLGDVVAAGDGSWSLPVSFADGEHTITARATDGGGNVSDDASPVTFTVDTVAPAVPAITTPTAGDHFSTNPVSVTGSADPNVMVHIVEGGTEIGTATTDGAGAWSVDLTFTDGAHTIAAFATDAAGNASGESSPVSFTVDAEIPEAPVIATPADGVVLSEGDVDVSGSAEAGSTVTVLEGGSSLGDVVAAGDGSWSLPVSFADGEHTITARATDGGGNVSDDASPVTFTVDTVAPGTPVIASPADGEVVTTDPVSVSGTGEPDSVVHVVEDGEEIGAAAVDALGGWSVDITFADGDHTIGAFATDAAGHTSGDATPVNFTVDANVPQAPVITAPTNGASFTVASVEIAGTAEPGTTVSVVEGTTSLGSVPVAGDGSWSVTPTFSDGGHTVTARATDSAGNVSPDAAPVSFTVDANAPTGLTVSFEDDDGLLTHAEAGSVFLGGAAEPGAVVEVVVSDTDGSTPNVTGSTFGASNGTWRLGPMDLTGLSDGTLTATAVAIDGAGNSSLPVKDTIMKSPSEDAIFAPKVKIKDGKDGVVSGADPDGDQPGDPGFRADEDPSAIEIVVTHTGPQPEAAVTLEVVDAGGTTISIDFGTVAMNAPATTIVDMSAFPEGTTTATATVTVDAGSVQGVDATTVDFNAAISEFTTEDGSTFLFLSIPFAPFGYSDIEFEGVTRDTATPIRFVVLDFERTDGTGFTRTAPLDTYALESGWTLSVDRLPPGDYTVTARSMDEAGHLETAGPEISVSVLGLL